MQDARVVLHAAHSAYSVGIATAPDGSFRFNSIPLGEYYVVVSSAGFADQRQSVTLASDTSFVVHFEMSLATAAEHVEVSAPESANVDSATSTTLVDREDIAHTPGADRTNSMAMITDFVPGAYMTHDMLHMRGGHQVDWQIDGVEIPNTNIGSNLAAQIDPKDIDYLEVQRGSYTADEGDRTYGVFNIVPRNGFERDRQGELVLQAGNFLQTNDQVNFGDHTEKFAYYGSASLNRSDDGLSPPVEQVVHNADNGFGGFLSLIYNRTSIDQFRVISMARRDFFQIPYDPSSTDFEALQYDSSGLRDAQRETDVADAVTYLHTFTSSTVLQLSPFYHYNKVDYSSNVNDLPVSTTYKRASNYAGGEVALRTVVARNTVEAGVYAFGQHDSNLFGAAFNPTGSGQVADFLAPARASAAVIEEYASDNFKATPWLTLIAGFRSSQFSGEIGESYIEPRFGLALRIPRIEWVFRAYYGRYYQPPPLLTVACGLSIAVASAPANCAVESFALNSGTTFHSLHGERDEEHQFGVQVPFRGWLLDVDNVKTRADNFLDHSNIGDSSIYFPVTIQGALVRAWELTLRTPSRWKFGQGHLAYSNQIAEQRGGLTGGLICAGAAANPDDPCYVGPGYSPLDHDQRNTLNLGYNATFPSKVYASMNYSLGSGFHNGTPDPTTPYAGNYLPSNRSIDLAVGKTFGERLSASVTATNVENHRTLLDNSLTFGGFHYNDPRQIFAEIRWKFHY